MLKMMLTPIILKLTSSMSTTDKIDHQNMLHQNMLHVTIIVDFSLFPLCSLFNYGGISGYLHSQNIAITLFTYRDCTPKLGYIMKRFSSYYKVNRMDKCGT